MSIKAQIKKSGFLCSFSNYLNIKKYLRVDKYYLLILKENDMIIPRKTRNTAQDNESVIFRIRDRKK